MPPKFTPRLKRVASRVTGVKTPTKVATPSRRKKRADVLTPDRWRIVTAYLEISQGKDRLPRGGFNQLKQRFPTLKLNQRTVQKLVKQYKEQSRDVETDARVDLRRKRSKCGGGGMKFSTDIANKMIELNDKHWGKLSCKRLAGKLAECGFKCSKESVRIWCKTLGAVRRRRYIKPKLSLRHKCDRLSWVIQEYDMAKRRFGDNKNIVHGDEKWFYLMHDGSVCRVFPQSIRNGDGELQRVVTMPASPKIYHKSRMPKVMFLAVTARPRPEHGFDGKLGLWPFTVTRTAKRSDSRTGTVAGETPILEPVTVNAEVYRNVMLRKGGVFDVMRNKMWWYGKNSGQPEAGEILWYQHDGARPHTAKANDRQWATHGKKKNFDIRVVTQPAQSLDLNCNDLAFFASLQSDVELVAKKNVTDLVKAVESCWEEYPSERMENVWRCLYGSFKGIVRANGDNTYSHHTGSRTAHSRSQRAGEKHDMSFPLKEMQRAVKLRDDLESQLEADKGVVAGEGRSSETDSSD